VNAKVDERACVPERRCFLLYSSSSLSTTSARCVLLHIEAAVTNAWTTGGKSPEFGYPSVRLAALLGFAGMASLSAIPVGLLFSL